jgi:O-antigen/teichoic acid export membrane protein
MSASLEPPATSDSPTPARKGALRRILRNAASSLLGEAAGEVLVAYSLVLAAVSLGPVGFGRLAEAQGFMDPFDALAGLGLGSIAMVVAAQRGGVDGALRGTIRGLRGVSAVVTIGLALLAALATGRWDLWPQLVAIAVGMMISPVSVVSQLPFRYYQTQHRRIVVPFLASLVRLSGAYLAFWFLRAPVGFQLAVLGGTTATAALDYRWAQKTYPDRPRFDKELARQLLRLGWPAAVFEVTIMIYMRASYFLLRGAGAMAEGQYAAADRLVKPLLSIAGALFVSSLPTIAAIAADGGFEQLRSTYRKALVRIVLVSVPLAAGTWFLAAWLLRRFAPEYAAAVWPLRALLVGAFFMFLNMLSTAFILALGRFRAIMVIVIVDLGVYLALAMHLIPKMGALGAAISTSLMEAVNTVMQVSLVFWLLRHASGGGPTNPPDLIAQAPTAADTT